MKFNKQVAVILVLLSMLLSAIAIAVYFYMENKKSIESSNQLVRIFVAKDDIKKDTEITKELIKETTIARQFVLTKPLLEKEIIGKFAKESIYKNETFLKEKLNNKVEEVIIEKKKDDYKFNSYNMEFKLFQNPNYSLEPDDIIKIISVFPAGMTNESTPKFSVQYVANNIRVLGFLTNGQESEKSITKKKIKKLVNKEQVEEIIEIKAEEIILDIKEDVLLSLIDDYNKGKQLWMVKSKLEDEITENKKEDETKKLENEKTVLKPKKYIPRSYPIRWYTPSSSTSTLTATITYSNNENIKDVKEANILSSFAKECSQKDKLLLATSDKIYLRTQPSIRAKIHNKIYKNYIIPYNSISKINPQWYMICDGSYIQRSDVKEISYDDYKKLKK